ncbi:Transposase, Mutator family [anaerobic digester metagenome]
MCSVHSIRAILRNIPKKSSREVVDRRRKAYGNEERLQTLADKLNMRRDRRVTNTVERCLTGLMRYAAFLKGYQKMGLNDERDGGSKKDLKRRRIAVGAFPRGDSFLCQVGAILRDVHEEWETGRRYVSMDDE